MSTEIDLAPGTGAAPDTSINAAPTRREIRSVLTGLMIVMGLAAIDQSIVATALPRIIAEFGGVAHLSWVVTAYVLASTATMPLYGKLSDQYGRKPALYAAILLFLLGSILSGLSQSLMQLIAFRAVQGLGAGGLLPLTQIIMGDLVPPAQRGRRQGSIAAVYAVCSVVGPLAGGIITDLLSWHWIFYANLPIGAVALYAIGRALHHTPPLRARRIDYVGAVLLTSSTTACLLVLALGGSEWAWNSARIAACGALAAALGVAFVLHARRTPEPVLPLALFHDRLFVIACVVLAFTFMGLLGSSLFFPLYFQTVEGISPAHSGFLTGPLMVGVVVSSIFNGRVLLRGGRYKPAQIAGLALATLAFAVLAACVASAQPLVMVEPAIIAVGLGLGLIMPNMTIAVQNALPASHRGVGTATLAFFRSLGGLVGVTGAGAILASKLRHSAVPQLASVSAHSAGIAHGVATAIYRHAIAGVFATGAGIIAIALGFILFLPELPLRTHPHPNDTSA
ncbi:MDR family MFS transporter [Paraburkholderia sp. J12]|uniref:MDR family MFS transporter n=1 Tax=Paraburkholderia sp. J12 TaxID=2805432 RepID=UPI002ABE255A|nr:MDR family MFS transporter [Paraburkholderia sp. J12]